MAALSVDVIKKIRRIQIQTTHLAQDILVGAYRSAFKGKGMEFEEDREYQPGDEVRDIDWNVTARMNHPYVKSFREEREISVMLLVDISASSRFGSGNLLKSELIAEIGAVIAFSAIKNQDKIGLILFSDRVEKYIPPKKGVRHVLRVIRDLLAFEPKGRGTDVVKALDYLGGVSHKTGVCFLISDFICPDFQKEASILSKKQDLIAICVSDPHETRLPRVNLVTLKDLETDTIITVDTTDRAIAEHLAFSSEDRIARCKQIMNQIGAGFIDIRTDRPYIPEIKKFFKIRGRRRR